MTIRKQHIITNLTKLCQKKYPKKVTQHKENTTDKTSFLMFLQQAKSNILLEINQIYDNPKIYPTYFWLLFKNMTIPKKILPKK